MKKIKLSSEDYDLIISALNIATEIEQKHNPEINWYAEALENLEFAWLYGEPQH